MAEAKGLKVLPSEVCWYFAANKTCRQGESCPFRHVPVDTPLICRYYLQHRCRFGRNCRYLHPDNDSDDEEEQDRQDVAGAVIRPVASTSGLRASTSKGDSDSGFDDEWGTLPRPASEWVHAPEFVPNRHCTSSSSEDNSHKSYAEVVNGGEFTKDSELCPYFEAGECELAEKCTLLHGDMCDLCGKACMHPLDREKQKQHNIECVKQHEKDMELSFAIARSKDKMCGICFEVIMEKNHREQRFGILPNCNHCFCLGCIRTWRQAKQFENNITRACPECRTASDFVCPSMFWVDTKEDKDKLITDYKSALSTKDCKYFKKGEGKCPFGNKCFYSHVLPDGSHVDVGPPSRQRRRNADGDIEMLHQIILWDFLEERDAHILYLDDIDWDDHFFTDSDYSDSEMDFLL